MEYPFGHHHHHHHRRDEDEQERYPPPNNNPAPVPPPGPTTYPPIQHVSHEINSGFGYPPPSSYPPAVQHVSHDLNPGFPNQYGAAAPSYNYNPSPPPPVQHVSHEINDQGFQAQPSAEFDRPHHHRPHFPHSSFIHHHAHEGGAGSGLFNKPTVRVYTKAETNFSLTVRDGKVILSRSDPNDIYQHWIKDEKYSTRVKDEEGFPSFALVNKATGLAMKHSIGATHPVQLIPYNPDVLDESVLWAESRDLGDGYRTIRMVNNIRLNLDAFNGDKNHGGVHEGTIAVLWEWKKGDNQRWKIAPYCKSFEVSLSL